MSEAVFVASLLNPDAAVPPGVIDPQGRPAPRRFDVYRNNVAVSLVRALEEGFPVVRNLVGAPFFTAMALLHVRACPPRGPLLMQYGAAFPQFLQGFGPVAHLPYLPDVARLELALRDSYHAADAVPVAAEALAALPIPDLLASRLRLAPSLRLLRSDWPVHAIWCANAEGGPAPVMRAEDVVVLRPGFDPRPHLLPSGGAEVLAALMGGATLEQALEPGGDGAALLTVLLQGGAIVEVLR